VSDTDPGGWVRADDGLWYPPDAVPPAVLRRGPGGSFVLDPEAAPDEDAVDLPGVTRRRRAADREAVVRAEPEAVGGPIRPSATIQFGRPPGTENRQAGTAAAIGSGLFLLAAVVPWAMRTPSHLSPAGLGWRDANGALGPGWVAALLGLAALVLAASALGGRIDTWLRTADATVAAIGLIVGVLEAVRILRAGDQAARLSDGLAGVEPSWGLVLVIGGAVSLGVAAAVHRSEPPAWRQGPGV
jgi:hypothetical protein